MDAIYRFDAKIWKIIFRWIVSILCMWFYSFFFLFFLSNVLIFLKLLETIFREWKLRYEGNFRSRSGVYSDEKITFERKIRENFIAYSLIFRLSS